MGEAEVLLKRVAELEAQLAKEQERAREAEWERDRLFGMIDFFAVSYWPFDYQWRTVDANGDITFHKKTPYLLPGGDTWLSDGHMDCPGKMDLLGRDHRDSLRARPQNTQR